MQVGANKGEHHKVGGARKMFYMTCDAPRLLSQRNHLHIACRLSSKWFPVRFRVRCRDCSVHDSLRYPVYTNMTNKYHLYKLPLSATLYIIQRSNMTPHIPRHGCPSTVSSSSSDSSKASRSNPGGVSNLKPCGGKSSADRADDIFTVDTSP